MRLGAGTESIVEGFMKTRSEGERNPGCSGLEPRLFQVSLLIQQKALSKTSSFKAASIFSLSLVKKKKKKKEKEESIIQY